MDLRVELVAARSPDPFAEVASLVLVGQVDGEARSLGSVRWDQGPLLLPERLPIGIERLWVEGLDGLGALRSAAVSPPLDLVQDPQDRLRLLFARVGALSRLERGIPARSGYRAVTSADGVLLLAGDDEQALSLGTSGEPEPGPRIPGGLAAAALVSMGDRIVAFGPDGFVVLEPGGLVVPIPVANVLGPVDLVDLDGRRAIGVDLSTGRLTELDLVDLRARAIGGLGGAAEAAAGLGPTGLVVATAAHAFVFDVRSGSTASVRLDLPGRGPGSDLVVTAAGAVVVAGGAGPVETLRFSTSPAETSTRAALASLPPLGPAQVFDAGGGQLVVASRDGHAAWGLDLLGRSAPLEAPGSPFALARHPDGTLRGVTEQGTLLAFAPGPELPELDSGRGLVPRDPGLWRTTDGGLEGSAERSSGPPAPLALGDSQYGDFDLEVTVAPVGRGQAVLLFDLDELGHHRVTLQRSARVQASVGRQRPDCPVADASELDEGAGPVPVRLVREDSRLAFFVNGQEAWSCRLLPRGGRLGLGVTSGTVRFLGLRLTGRPPE